MFGHCVTLCKPVVLLQTRAGSILLAGHGSEGGTKEGFLAALLPRSTFGIVIQPRP